ncbi:MAG TPA: Hsp20/alpha crystallin family protein [Polyangiaceae bacterium]|nr:Hsp20/alpha crystallin family protein [Polyangiaceae bacterium]
MFDYDSFRRFDRVFDDVMGSTFGTATHRRAFSPSIDVFSDDERALFVCDLPGVKSEALDVTVEGRVLTIRGTRKFADPGQGKNAQVLLGRSYGTFARSFTLPDDLDVSRLSAELADGVLTVRIPKLEASRPRRVQVAVKSALSGGASPEANLPESAPPGAQAR